MKSIRVLAAGIALVGLVATGVAFAQGPRGGGPGIGRGGPRGPMGPGGGPGLALRGLDLTDAQRQQIQEIRNRYRDEGADAASRLQAAQQALRAAVETVPANEGLIISVTQQLVQAQIDVAINQAHLNTDVWAVLTPAQQEQATKLKADQATRLEERRQRMEERRQQRP